MRPLRVKLVHRESDNYRRLCGWWSYAVPEFTWEAVKVPASFDRVRVGGCDLVVVDDWIFGQVQHDKTPMAYVTVDSARSSVQLERNLGMAKQANIVLVDSDALHKFLPSGKPVRRFAYAVNEHLYRPVEHTYDVAFLCWPTPERRLIEQQVREICYRRGWTYLTGTWTDPLEYAAKVGKAKVVVHWQHVREARSWRVFDVMACKGALLTNPIPLIDGDGIEPGTHYWEYGEDNLEHRLVDLVGGEWKQVAQAGYDHVIAHHTWKTRAAQLRKLLAEELSL